MRKSAFVFLLLLAPVAYPCGDKLSSINRGVRLQRAFAGKALSIVILSSPNLTRQDTGSIRSGLTKVGHRVEMATTTDELKSMISSSPRDLVLAAVEDVPSVYPALTGAEPSPALIRVLHDPSAAEWREETKRCPLVMRLPGNTIERIQAIDAAVKTRNRLAGRNCNVSTSVSP